MALRQWAFSLRRGSERCMRLAFDRYVCMALRMRIYISGADETMRGYPVHAGWLGFGRLYGVADERPQLSGYR